MANTHKLRRRIKSIKNTTQITKAMQMVAATKMRRAQEQAASGRPYNENLYLSIARLLPKVSLDSHQLLMGNGAKGIGVIVLSTDKGLVGALNTNLVRKILAMQFSPKDLSFYTVGKKVRNFVVRTGQNLQADFENIDTVSFRQAKLLSRLLIDAFLAQEIGQLYLVYPHFISTIKQEARQLRLLPISLSSILQDSRELGKDSKLTVSQDDRNEFLFEPEANSLLDLLLVHYIDEQIYQALLETKASEHSARMIAMQNATDNAKQLLEDLNLTYNQTRQAAITTELLEITTAQVAMQ